MFPQVLIFPLPFSHLQKATEHAHGASWSKYNAQFFNLPSDLMKSTVVDES